MKECILSVFWPKADIIDFFRNNGCIKSDFKGIEETNLNEINRAQIINIVFENLQKRGDGSLGQIRSMLKSLINWSTFNPYYFDKIAKLDRSQAERNITHLKQLQEIRDAKLKDLKKERETKEQSLKQKHITQQELKDCFLNLYLKKDGEENVINNQKRGYLFEQFLKNLFLLEDMGVSDSIKIKGEQIDGNIKYEGENYICEAKWQDHLTASNALYNFAYKVEGKLYGRGLFISVNGFSTDSVNALVNGKALKTILIDGGDLTLVVEGIITFKDLLDNKIKAAQTMGKIYVNAISMKDKY